MNALKGMLITSEAALVTVYGAPIIVWGSGAFEGCLLCICNVSEMGLKILCRQPPENRQRTWNKLKRNAYILQSCALLTGVSIIPVAGTYYGWKMIVKETVKYHNIREAVNDTRHRSTVDSTETYENLMDEDADMYDIAEEHLDQLRQGQLITVGDLSRQDQRLDNTLIRYYKIFTLTHFCAEEGIRNSALGLKWAGKGIVKTFQVTRKIFGTLFKTHFLKDALFYTLKTGIKMGKFGSEVFQQEIRATIKYSDGEG